jgi:membrane protein
MRAFTSRTWQVLRATANGYLDNKVPRLAAALAFYTALSISPMIVIALAIAGTLYGEQAAQGLLLTQIRTVVGPEGGRAIQAIVANAQSSESGWLSFLLSSAVLVVSASGVFAELQGSLNTIWGVAPKPGLGLLKTITDRFLSFAMVLGTGFLLLVSLIVSTVLSAMAQFVGLEQVLLGQTLSMVLSFALIAVLFAAILKVLPDVELSWRDVWLGALVTTVLFLIGKFLIGIYLGQVSLGSTYGAAGSLIVFLVWVFYSAQIVLIGAELTRALVDREGSPVQPTANAEPLTDERRAQQGLKNDRHLAPSNQP